MSTVKNAITLAALTLCLICGIALAQTAAESGAFTDARDGQEYRTVKIGKQVWMAENLNYETGNSWCYKDKESNCQKYGRLYDWNAAMKACPAGWHLPSRDEWNSLVLVAGGSRVAGKRLKSKTGWSDWTCDIDYHRYKGWDMGNCIEGRVYRGNGTDENGFSALPGGFRYNGAGYEGHWWSSTEHGNEYAHYRYMNNYNVVVGEAKSWKSVEAFSVRCVLDD